MSKRKPLTEVERAALVAALNKVGCTPATPTRLDDIARAVFDSMGPVDQIAWLDKLGVPRGWTPKPSHE